MAEKGPVAVLEGLGAFWLLLGGVGGVVLVVLGFSRDTAAMIPIGIAVFVQGLVVWAILSVMAAAATNLADVTREVAEWREEKSMRPAS